MSRHILAIAAILLPLPALAQSAPASSAKPASAAAAVPEQTKPEKRGFSIARAGATAPAAKTVPAAAKPARMAAQTAMPEEKAGKMKRHMHRRYHRTMHRHH